MSRATSQTNVSLQAIRRSHHYIEVLKSVPCRGASSNRPRHKDRFRAMRLGGESAVQIPARLLIFHDPMLMEILIVVFCKRERNIVHARAVFTSFTLFLAGYVVQERC